MHQSDLAPKVQRQIGRTAIWTEECDGIHSVRTSADVAREITEQVLADRDRAGPAARLVFQPHADNAVARVPAIEVPGEIAKPVAHIGDGIMTNLSLDSLDIRKMREFVIIRSVACIRTHRLARPRRAENSGVVLVANLSLGGSAAD